MDKVRRGLRLCAHILAGFLILASVAASNTLNERGVDYSYDDLGRLIKTKYWTSDSTFTLYTYTYDPAGNRILVEVTDGTESSGLLAVELIEAVPPMVDTAGPMKFDIVLNRPVTEGLTIDLADINESVDPSLTKSTDYSQKTEPITTSPTSLIPDRFSVFVNLHPAVARRNEDALRLSLSHLLDENEAEVTELDEPALGIFGPASTSLDTDLKIYVHHYRPDNPDNSETNVVYRPELRLSRTLAAEKFFTFRIGFAPGDPNDPSVAEANYGKDTDYEFVNPAFLNSTYKDERETIDIRIPLSRPVEEDKYITLEFKDEDDGDLGGDFTQGELIFLGLGRDYRC